MTTRPLLHFTAAVGWINDPLGLTFHDGTYHLFFQYVPHEVAWTPACHWGHATSRDMIEWAEQPIALSPGDNDAGCWSGSVVRPTDREAVMFYTSAQESNLELGRVRRARPADESWQDWIKEDFVVDAPDDREVVAFRDPFVFRDGDVWRMLVGAGCADGNATAFVYQSTDLKKWDYTGQLAERSRIETDAVWTGAMWECVQLIPLSGRHLLVMSVYDDSVLHYVACAVGAYRDGRFIPERWVRLTYGPSPYAASFYLDEFGQPGLIAWLRGVEDPDGGWAGALTVPMLLSLDDQGLPVVRPHPHLARRRQRELPGGSDRAQWPVGAAVEVEWQPRDGLRDALVLTAADDVMVAEVSIVDRSLTLNIPASDVLSMPWPGGDIQLLLDGPVLEIFCGGMLMAAAVNPHHQELRASSPDGMPHYRYWMLASRSVPPGS